MNDLERPKNATDALTAHLALLPRDIERCLALFADDASVEFPYAVSAGTPQRLVGKPAIAAYLSRAPEVFLGLTFSEPRIHSTVDPQVAIAEVHGSATIATTGRRYEQDYVILVECRDGRIVRYREYWDAARAMAAMGGTEAAKTALGVS